MRNYIYSFLLVTMVMACSKEEALSDNQLISSSEGKKWVLNEVIVDTIDVTDSLESCVLDNERIFYSDNTYEITEGDTVCVGEPADTASGTWMFNDIKTTLKIAVGTDTAEYIIKELYKNQMRLFFVDQSTGDAINWKLVTK